jgi:hypothetical protein
MDYSEEIHAINIKLTEIVASIDVIKERRTNDKESAEKLADEVDKLAIAVNRLNLTIERADGKTEGITTAVKTFRILLGSLVFISIVSMVTIVFINTTDIATLKEKHKVK